MTFFVGIWFLSLTIETLNGVVSGGTVDDVKRLKTRLFERYDRHIRPVLNQSTTLQMEMSLILLSIDTLDMKRQRLLWNGVLGCTWIDEGLSWNSSFYGNTDFIMIPQSQIWIPDLVLYNDVQSQQHLGAPDTLVFVRSSGLVTWEPSILTETSCRIDIRKYPFDEQTCRFVFCPWMSPKSRLNITALHDMIKLYDFAPHGEYSIAKTSVEYAYIFLTNQGEDLVCLNFSMTMQRRPTFYWMMMIFPMMTFPLLCPISFLVPVDNGEKITLSITVVLSFLVFIGSMNEAMPKLSDTVSLLGHGLSTGKAAFIPKLTNTVSLLILFSSVQTAVGMLTVVANGIIICISNLPPHFKVPNFKNVMKTNEAMDGSAKVQIFTTFEKKQEHSLKAEKPCHCITKTNWSIVARKLDTICFVLFSFLIIIVSVVFVCVMLT